MKIFWLGHASFRIEISGQVLLIDPWLEGNPSFPNEMRNAALTGATHILVTHGHFDHTAEVAKIAQETGAVICGSPELVYRLGASEPIDFNKGGTIHLGDIAVTMVNAVHSSSLPSDEGGSFAGTECGYMIAGEGHTIYVTGDTDIMADMEWMGDYHNPDVGLLCAGGHYTMDMARAVYAAKRYFNFKTVIPCHYKTFGALEQSAQSMVENLPGVDVRTPDVMEAIVL